MVDITTLQNQVSKLQNIVTNTYGNYVMYRDMMAAFLGYSHSGRRDLYAQFGWKRTLQFRDYYALYKRNPVASRIVRAFPQATWKDIPSVTDDGKRKTKSKFEEAYEKLMETTNAAFHFERADRLAGIGRYSVLFLGFSDGRDPAKPLSVGTREGMPDNTASNPLLFMTPYAEENAQVTRWDLDPTSPRFGKPLFYRLQKGNVLGNGRPTQQSVSMTVHYSRLIHFAEQLDDDDIYGTPRLECSINHLNDLEKVLGGSAETFWLNARQGLSIMADKDVSLTPADIADMKEQATEFEHQLRRTLAMRGARAEVMNANIADPKSNVDGLLDVIAGGQGMPKRILIGSERGELASSQDESNWSAKIDERRCNYIGPMVMRPWLDTMIATGNLPRPNNNYYQVTFPDVAAQSPKEAATVAGLRVVALRDYMASPGAEIIVPPAEFRDMIGLDPESNYEEFEEQDEPIEDDVDENDTEVTDQFGRMGTGPNATKPADKALSGQQVTSLLDIMDKVVTGALPADAAKAAVKVAFPSLGDDEINQLIDPLEEHEKPQPPMPNIVPGGPDLPPAPGQPPGFPARPKPPAPPKVA